MSETQDLPRGVTEQGALMAYKRHFGRIETGLSATDAFSSLSAEVGIQEAIHRCRPPLPPDLDGHKRYVKILNEEIAKHSNYEEGMSVNKVEHTAIHMSVPPCGEHDSPPTFSEPAQTLAKIIHEVEPIALDRFKAEEYDFPPTR